MSESQVFFERGFAAAHCVETAVNAVLMNRAAQPRTTVKPLCVFAKEEYGVELPVDAGQETLMRAIFELAKSAPENRDRLVLMAHTIRFNLDETFEEIRRQSEGATEVERKEVYL